MTRTTRVWHASPAQPSHRAMKARAMNQAYGGSLAVADTVRRRANGTPKANQTAFESFNVGMACSQIATGADTVSRPAMGFNPQSLFLMEGYAALSVRRYSPYVGFYVLDLYLRFHGWYVCLFGLLVLTYIS